MNIKISGDIRNRALDFFHKLELALDAAQVAAFFSAKRSTAFKDRTGKLRASIKPGKVTRGIGARSIVANRKYAYFVENGTLPHIITARDGGMLKFKVGGRTIFRKSVLHPGTKGAHFMHGAIKPGLAAFMRVFNG